jgi:hypothetical protein
MHVFYNEGYTDIEMEAGPYLSGIYEDIYPQRYPVNEIVNAYYLPTAHPNASGPSPSGRAAGVSKKGTK